MRLKARVALFTGAVIVMTACGGGESAERTRNTTLSTRWTMPYSCAQLLTDQATTETSEIRFTLCAEAETYSIVTPSGVNGSVEEASATGVKEVVVPISPQVDGPTTRLVVRVAGAKADDINHPGVHIYRVSLSRATEELVGAGSPMIDVVYPKVRYDMPLPQTSETYRQGPFGIADARTTYASYVEELGQKWAMVRYTTCLPTLADAVMANVDKGRVSGAASHAQVSAKRARNAPWFIALDSLRMTIGLSSDEVNICPAGVQGVNVFSQGIEVGFIPIDPADIAASTDSTRLLKSYAVVRYWEQVARELCPKDSTVMVAAEQVDSLRAWTTSVYERLIALADDESRSLVERRTARRAADQATMIGILEQVRRTSGSSNWCSAIPAGYAVPVVRAQVETQAQTEATVPPVVESTSDSSLVPGTTAPPADASASPSNESVPQAALSWPAATSTGPLRVRVGRSVSRVDVLSRSRLAVSSGSRVTIRPLGSSTRVCSASTWGVKALRAGTCKVRVAVTTRGAQTQVATVSIRVTK